MSGKNIGIAVFLVFIVLVTMSSYNGHVTRDEAVTAAWSEVTNQYKRRSDLVPNLVQVVQGYASHEKETFTAVTNARKVASEIKVDQKVLEDPAMFQKFQDSQGQLTQALSRLMVVAENYPTLKANEGFRDLQTQLEGTENRITVARGRYIKSVQAFNQEVRNIPFGALAASLGNFQQKPTFQVEDEKAISDAPKVDFGKK